MSSSAVSSATSWLRPSMLGTNSIAAGASRPMIIASWPAPRHVQTARALGRRGGGETLDQPDVHGGRFDRSDWLRGDGYAPNLVVFRDKRGQRLLHSDQCWAGDVPELDDKLGFARHHIRRPGLDADDAQVPDRVRGAGGLKPLWD